jgi:phage terminase small subunit
MSGADFPAQIAYFCLLDFLFGAPMTIEKPAENLSTETLNHKQLRFVHEYLQDQNAAAAARRAGYSDSTRGSHAAALMKNPLIRARIDAEMTKLFERLRINAFRLLQAQSRAAFCDPRKLFSADGTPVPLHELDEETAGALTVSYEDRPKGKVLRVKQSPRHLALAALEKRYEKFTEERVEPQPCADIEEKNEPGEAAPASMKPPALTEPSNARTLKSAPPCRPKGARSPGRSADWRSSGLLNSLFATPPQLREDNPVPEATGA